MCLPQIKKVSLTISLLKKFVRITQLFRKTQNGTNTLLNIFFCIYVTNTTFLIQTRFKLTFLLNKTVLQNYLSCSYYYRLRILDNTPLLFWKSKHVNVKIIFLLCKIGWFLYQRNKASVIFLLFSVSKIITKN